MRQQDLADLFFHRGVSDVNIHDFVRRKCADHFGERRQDFVVTRPEALACVARPAQPRRGMRIPLGRHTIAEGSRRVGRRCIVHMSCQRSVSVMLGFAIRAITMIQFLHCFKEFVFLTSAERKTCILFPQKCI